MLLETILEDAVHVEETERRPMSGVSGRWCNRLGSILDLAVAADHRIHGSFRTRVGGPMVAADFPVAGFAEGDAVSFCVDFGRRGSVASWAGHHVSDEHGERLVTLWHLAQPVRNPHSELDVWRALMAGADEFTRLPE